MLELRRKAIVAFALLVSTVVAAAPPDAGEWHSQLTYQGSKVTAAATDDGFTLTIGGNEEAIPKQAAGTQTGSLLFDALFALAQDELGKVRVERIRYDAFNHDEPIACSCLVAGERWPWVWTRDIAYATDLALFRFDPVHARNSLEFKLSPLRADATPPSGHVRDAADNSLYVVQDTGSGGSWPISTDRVAWFLGARHLLHDAAFAAKVYKALTATLAQDRSYAFDARRGLYRGETSFLDWREQTYPAWTAHNVTFIAESFALSTNVLHYQALQLAATMAAERHADTAARYREQAAALKIAIDRQFWREDRGLYMSYIDGADAPQAIEAYDLLGTSLAIISGVAPPAHARRALAGYPTWDAGTPAVWPERKSVPVYHNRAIWPFASAYALKAARALDDPARIAHELRSILRGAAITGSNMENHELTPAGALSEGPLPETKPSRSLPPELRNSEFPVPADSHRPPAGAKEPAASATPKSETSSADGAGENAEQGKPARAKRPPRPPIFKMPNGHDRVEMEFKHRGPVVNSRRQLWSIAAYLDLVVEGVFGLTDEDTIEPKLPRELLPMLFGDREEIRLDLPDRRITLVKPKHLAEQDTLLVAASTSGPRADTRVQLRGMHAAATALPEKSPFYAPETPGKPSVVRDGDVWRVHAATPMPLQLYVNAQPLASFTGETTIPYRPERECVSLTARGADGLESLPSEPVCVGETARVGGDWPRSWNAERSGRYELRLEYVNANGPIMTGITAAVKKLRVECAGAPAQSSVVVMPHSRGKQWSTGVAFEARAGQRCTFALDDGFNMSRLAQYANYTGGNGGIQGPLNTAEIGELSIAPLP